MISVKWKVCALTCLVLAAAWLGGSPAAAQFKCMPTCSSTDARFLAVASGPLLITLSEPTLDLEVAVPAGTTSFTVGVFDGDARGLDGSGIPHWDTGTAATFTYTLYADPTRTRSTSTPVDLLPGFPTVPSTSMPDNAWIDFPVNTGVNAQAPSGHYFYFLRIQLSSLSVTILNAFKIRTGDAQVGGSTLFPTPEPFSYIANVTSNPDIFIVYPNFSSPPPPGVPATFPALLPTNYNGMFQFFYDVPVTPPDMTVWDGDFDRGSVDGMDLDTDDPDTPALPTPDWSTLDTLPEGVAVGLLAPTPTTGSPPDDRSGAGSGAYLRKSPSVRYDLIFPDGQIFANNNPSGNQEWEQFRISPAPFDPSEMDHSSPIIPPGIYELRMQGVDMQNLNALLFPGRALCVDESGIPCEPLRPFLLGDTIFLDLDGSGFQDPGEPGIAGGFLELRDDAGALIATTTTDANGHYSFGVEAFPYRVVISPENFSPESGGVLIGYTPTTPEDCTETIVDGNVLTCDFGFQQPGSIGNRVWSDYDGDGIQDPGEPGINNIIVILEDGDGNFIADQVTSVDGNYSFVGLQPGTYTVRVDTATLPAGVTQTFDFDGVATPDVATVILAASQAQNDVDFGYQGHASLGDRVWADYDNDGFQDPGEPGINGVTVNLYDFDLNLAGTAVTAGDGTYTFSNLLEGTYEVRVDDTTLPAGAQQTYDLDGLGTPHSATVDLGPDDNRTDVDFGYRGTASVGDRVWNDISGDGIQDVGEAGINGVTVELLDAGNNVVATTVTSVDGNYTFGGLFGGAYSVRVAAGTLPAGYAPTFDFDGNATPHIATFSLNVGDNRTDIDFGYRAAANASVGDRVWHDLNNNSIQDVGEPGINGVTVELLDSANSVVATTVTAGDGNYTFNNLAAGDYSVRVVSATVPPGYVQTYDLDGLGTPHIASFSLAINQNRTDVDFGYRAPTDASVGDRVWRDDNGDGIQDVGEPGLNGVTVELLDSSNNVVATTVTAGDGTYTFDNLAAGDYSVRVVSGTLPAGYTPTFDFDGVGTPHVATFTLATSEDRTDIDFGYEPPANASVGDRVWKDDNGDGVQDPGESGINGVTVQLLDSGNNVVATTVTAGDGNYTFSNLAAGTYSVRVVIGTLPAGYTQTYDLDGVGTAHIATFPLAISQNRTDVDFGYRAPANSSVGDRVWNDADGDGVQDAGEPGLNGVTVQLLDDDDNVIATTVTAGNGIYSFNNLAAGTYRVRVVNGTLPGGYTPTFDLDGIGTPHVATFTLTGTAGRTDVDFGYRGTFSVGDRVWNDADGDGVQDGTETGLNGVTVQLLDSGNNVIATTVTAGNGNYTFSNLGAGTYTVRVVSGTLPAGFVQTFDIDGTGSAHQATFNLTATRTDVDFGYRTPPVVCTAGTFKDTFTNNSFSNNDGSLSWSAPWVENDTAGAGVSSGNVTVGNPVSGYMILRDSPDTGTQPSAARQVNLTGYASATLTVDFHIRGSETDDVAVIEVSNNGGSTYTVLDTLSGFTGTFIDSRTYNISAFMASNTRIRFRIASNFGGSDDYFKLDVVRIDASCTPPPAFSVGDRVWKDTDGDGVQDSGEPGISNVTVQLLNSSNTVIATDTTDNNGIYSFTNVAVGTYTVRVVSSSLPAGYTQTYDLDGVATAHQATFSLTANRTDVDFGYRPAVCTGGTFKDTFTNNSFSNNEGSLSWSAAWVESDTAGAGVSSGNVTVGTPVSGYMILNDSPDTGSQPSAARQVNLTGYAFASLTVDFHIRGVETDDAVVIEVSNNGGSSYTVLETLTGYTGTYINSRTYNISSFMASNTRIRFRISANYGGDDDFFKVDVVRIDASCTPQTYSVGDRVWKDTDGDGVQDSGEAGLSGVTVQLLNSSNTVIATATTDSNGNYTFTNVTGGTYTVKVASSSLPAGYAPTYDLDGLGTAHTATFSLSANRTDVDFGYRQPPAFSVGDRVWKDTDGDGVQDSGEVGLSGVTVQLLNSANTVVATATTNSSGNYSFTNIATGTYTVKVTGGLPAGYVPTYDLDGLATPHAATFTLSANRTDVDFGYRLPPCTAGSFKDTFSSNSFSNNNGTLSWSGAWIESDVAGTGVSSGNVTVGSPVSGYLILRDSPDTGTQPSAARQADLSAHGSATLTVDFHIRGAEADDTAVIEVSNRRRGFLLRAGDADRLHRHVHRLAHLQHQLVPLQQHQGPVPDRPQLWRHRRLLQGGPGADRRLLLGSGAAGYRHPGLLEEPPG